MRRTPISVAGCAVSLAVALGLAACGEDEPAGPPTGDGLVVESEGDLTYDKDAYTSTVNADGEVELVLYNRDSIQHTLLVEDHEEDLRLSVNSRGQSDRGSIALEPGEYTVYCDIAGHREGGMEAELTVEEATAGATPPSR
jgi:plastocyanin